MFTCLSLHFQTIINGDLVHSNLNLTGISPLDAGIYTCTVMRGPGSYGYNLIAKVTVSNSKTMHTSTHCLCSMYCPRNLSLSEAMRKANVFGEEACMLYECASCNFRRMWAFMIWTPFSPSPPPHHHHHTHSKETLWIPTVVLFFIPSYCFFGVGVKGFSRIPFIFHQHELL